MIREYLLDGDILQVRGETEKLTAFWVADESSSEGIFFVIDVRGVDVLIPSSSEEVFSEVQSQNERAQVQTLELSEIDDDITSMLEGYFAKG